MQNKRKKPMQRATTKAVTKGMQLMGPEVEYLDRDEQDEIEGVHKALHAGIKQEDMTIFKINAVDWNNVPNVVYDAFCTLITRIDANVLAQQKDKKDVERELKNIRNLIDGHDRLIEDNFGKVTTAFESNFKKTNDKVKSLNNEQIDKNAMMSESIAELKRACDDAQLRVHTMENNNHQLNTDVSNTKRQLTSSV